MRNRDLQIGQEVLWVHRRKINRYHRTVRERCIVLKVVRSMATIQVIGRMECPKRSPEYPYCRQIHVSQLKPLS